MVYLSTLFSLMVSLSSGTLKKKFFCLLVVFAYVLLLLLFMSMFMFKFMLVLMLLMLMFICCVFMLASRDLLSIHGAHAVFMLSMLLLMFICCVFVLASCDVVHAVSLCAPIVQVTPGVSVPYTVSSSWASSLPFGSLAEPSMMSGQSLTFQSMTLHSDHTIETAIESEVCRIEFEIDDSLAI